MSAVFYWTIMSSLGFVIFVVSLVINIHKLNKELNDIIHPEMSCEQMKDLEEKISVFLYENSIDPSSSISDIGKGLNLNIDELLDEEEYKDAQNKNIIIARKCSQLISATSEDSYLSDSELTQTSLPQGKKTEIMLSSSKGMVPAEERDDNEEPKSLPSSKRDTKEAKETDYITIALLMPFEEISSYLSKNSFQSAPSQKQKKLTQKLCDKYEVDIMTVLRRIQEVYIIDKAS